MAQCFNPLMPSLSYLTGFFYRFLTPLHHQCNFLEIVSWLSLKDLIPGKKKTKLR